MLAARLLNFTRSARHVSKPIWYVNSLQKIPVALKSLKTFFHCSSSGYSWRTLPVFRWWFLPQWGLALNFSYSLSSMVLWYSSMPNAPGRKGTYHQRCLHYFSSCGANHFRILFIGLDLNCRRGYWGELFKFKWNCLFFMIFLATTAIQDLEYENSLFYLSISYWKLLSYQKCNPCWKFDTYQFRSETFPPKEVTSRSSYFFFTK